MNGFMRVMAFLIIFILLSTPIEGSTQCPAFVVGDPVVLRTGDVFEGLSGFVEAYGWSNRRGDVYVIRVEGERGLLPATGCELSH